MGRSRLSVIELRRAVARQQTIGDIIDLVDSLPDDAVEPALHLICGLTANVWGRDMEVRRWVMTGALVSRYLFSVLGLPMSRDWLI